MPTSLLFIWSYFIAAIISATAEPQRNIEYDSKHERNVLDFWPAKKSDQPAPLLVWFHGGGFRNGDKTQLEKRGTEILNAYQEAGYAVASCNYPFLSDDIDYPDIAKHCARAMQFIRSEADEWNINPQRVVCGGVSAGALISEFLGYHNDFADPQAKDLVARQSSRPAVVVSIMQPRGTKEFALRFMDKGEAPIFLYSNAAPSDRIHPLWAVTMMRDKANDLGIPCVALGGGRNKLPKPGGEKTWLELQLEFCNKHLPGAEARGDGEFSITQSWSQEENYERPYWVNIPAQITHPLPVLILLHGNGGNAKGIQKMILKRYPKIAQQYITVFPEGYKESWNIVSERSKADDLGFIESIIQKLAKRGDVKKEEFTVMGFSNGAALANQIAIESQLPNIKNIITAVSPLNGYQHDGKNFKAKGDDNNYNEIAAPRTDRRLLNISGTDDPLVPYEGGPSNAIPAKSGKLPFIAAEESIFLWAKQLGYEASKLTKPSQIDGEIETFSYLDGDVIHLRANERAHNAGGALSERLLLEFLQE